MPPALRTLVPALALAAVALGSPGAVSTASPEPSIAPPVPPEGVVDEALLFRLPLRLPPPPPTLGDRAATVALEAVGTPYRWGGSSPESGFDCSGLVYWAFGRLGLELPHSSYALYDLGRRVPRSKLKRGDLLFFAGLGHVGVYVGRNRMVHAPQTGGRVEVVKLGGPYYGGQLAGARRLARAATS
jgi:cell wall-associated NlpC family hydrolase